MRTINTHRIIQLIVEFPFTDPYANNTMQPAGGQLPEPPAKGPLRPDDRAGSAATGRQPLALRLRLGLPRRLVAPPLPRAPAAAATAPAERDRADERLGVRGGRSVPGPRESWGSAPRPAELPRALRGRVGIHEGTRAPAARRVCRRGTGFPGRGGLVSGYNLALPSA